MMTITALRRLMRGSLVVSTLAACGPGSGVYCQSGPKYGTQCYSEADVREDPKQRGTEQPGPRKGEPPATPPPNQVRW
jgi:hypothetical protein